ncbi:MAG: hypothetical protein HC817_01810 [Saprospiraceae bacterium]|nr:hypothetical protein [Saprospiraceae bacterium]
MLFNKYVKVLTALYVVITLPYFAYNDIQNYWSLEKSGGQLQFDLITHKEALRKAVPKTARCIIMNDNSTFVFSYLIDKQGFIFDSSHLPPEWMNDMIDNKGARYFYCSNRKIDTSQAVKPFLDSLILQRGIINVYKLKSSQRRSNTD